MAENTTERLMGGAPPLMVRVKSPATLPGGYTFQALLNDDPNRPFICEVVRHAGCDVCLDVSMLPLLMANVSFFFWTTAGRWG